ncbi:probable NAD kinase 2, chloroplastic [Durio zibethinus]|uniref:Probable NAD kinase 2, chloroplastic n=1 Tax=Durio zibethinus TaxID=66656 RepID=A0A6P5Z912_DURZI|nr:probable NAD kinase 2, chloroplastic [Durio zibethinus]XP_022748974.1 probable NAD kinase 2, chloroplastic [Durio zibethinus]XP_022748980.1 probable NAD kinase 2, chloroplastic [Durio zibethinus]
MPRNLVLPQVFDKLHGFLKDSGAQVFLCCEPSRNAPDDFHVISPIDHVHPNVPCMLFTPICPHSLSFRSVILPDSARLKLKIPDDAWSNAWVSFDGKRRQQLSRGHSVRISMSQHPLPTVNKSDQTCDWLHCLIRCLNSNERMDQKAL